MVYGCHAALLTPSRPTLALVESLERRDDAVVIGGALLDGRNPIPGA